MEAIIEAITNEVNDLKPCPQKKNLGSYCCILYRQWEELQTVSEECERLEDENEVLRKLLSETLDSECKKYIRIKYDLEV